MADYSKFYKRVKLAEGGYVNDKDDKGGETYKGISRVNHPNWLGWVTIDQLKKHHPTTFKSILNRTPELEKKVYDFYKEKYWDVFELDSFNSQRIAEELADTAVNCGHVAAVKIAQRVLNERETGRWSLSLLNKLVNIE